MFWAIERLRRIFVGVTWRRLKKSKETNNNNNSSARSTSASSKNSFKNIGFDRKTADAGSRRCARRKYLKLEPEMTLEELGMNARNNNETKLVIQPDGLVLGSSNDRDFNDVTSSEASETETDPDEAEALTCNVCDRGFLSMELLLAHQVKRRHYGCSACESVFQTLPALERHKEDSEHWSDDDSQDMPDSDDDSDDSQDNCAVGVTMAMDEETGLSRGVTPEKERLL